MTPPQPPAPGPATTPAPPTREEIVRRLRGIGARRPKVDPGLAGGVRDWLEDLVAGPAASLPGQAVPLRVSKRDLTEVLRCERRHAAGVGRPTRLTTAIVRGQLVDALFRQLVTVGALGDPLTDGLAALAASGDGEESVAFVADLPASQRAALADEVGRHVAGLTERWPALPDHWLVRTQERLVAPLAGGRIVVSGVVDLVLGAPAAEDASVCLVEVKSGRRDIDHRADMHLYALLETLRSGAPPFAVATYYTAGGELDVEPVGEPTLHAAVERLGAALRRLCRVAAGAQPLASPNPLCRWCVGLADCPEGRRRVEEVDGGDGETATPLHRSEGGADEVAASEHHQPPVGAARGAS